MLTGPQSTAGRKDIDTVLAILDAAGKQALGMFHQIDKRRIREKSPGDFVSDADRALEIALCERLRLAFPGDGLCGEEFGGRPVGTYWMIDPIDGTSNFLSGLPLWCISIARMTNDVPHLGAINAPALGLSAAGGPGIGFKVRGTTALPCERSRPCFGVGRNANWSATERALLESRLESRGFNIVSLGSCAVSLLFVALGRLSGYLEIGCDGIWDPAGGIALCRANGIRADFRIARDSTVDVKAGLSAEFPDDVRTSPVQGKHSAGKPWKMSARLDTQRFDSEDSTY